MTDIITYCPRKKPLPRLDINPLTVLRIYLLESKEGDFESILHAATFLMNTCGYSPREPAHLFSDAFPYSGKFNRTFGTSDLPNYSGTNSEYELTKSDLVNVNGKVKERYVRLIDLYNEYLQSMENTSET
jgi:hypothetical protein